MSKIIHISYFLNPNCFYFKFDEDLHDDRLKSLENDIAKYAHDKFKQSNDEPTSSSIGVGDLVVAYVIPWGKWVRSVVRCNLEDLQNYELWAIDHGKLFRAEYKNVIPLPDQYNNENVIGIRRGSIYRCSPAKLEFNLNTYQKELQPTESWSDKAIIQCRDLLRNDNITTTFFDIKATRANCYFGDISIKTSAKLLDIAHSLIQIDEAVENDLESELDQIEFKYRKFNVSGLRSHASNGRADYMNGSSGRSLMESVHRQNCNTDTQSCIQSTIVPSEIDGGITRMKMKRGFCMAPPSCVQSTVIASEIDGGATRMQKHTLQIAPPSELANGNAHKQMPKNANRKIATNYVNGGIGSTVKRQTDTYMPAGHEPDIDNFRKYNL